MVTGDDRLSPQAQVICLNPANELVFSAASSWELAIKHRLGRLALPAEPRRFVPNAMQEFSLEGLAVSHAHALCVASLPKHHTDPFDRLLVAQGEIESLAILSPDSIFDLYGLSRLW